MKNKHIFWIFWGLIMIIIIFMLSPMLYPGKDKLTTHTEYYPNGKVSKIYQAYKHNGEFILNGKYTMWYNNGQKAYEGEFIDNARHGKWLEWYRNGKIRSIKIFKNGLLEGHCKYWYINGMPSSDTMYKNCMECGPAISWYDNGQIEEICTYSAGGYLDQTYKKFHKNGQLAILGKFKAGKQIGSLLFFDASGKKISKSEYLKKYK